MKRHPSLSGDADGVFERRLYDLVMRRSLSLIGLDDLWAIGVFPGEQAPTVVARAVPELWEPLGRLAQEASSVGLRVLVVGGAPTNAETLRAGLPWASGTPMLAWHLADDGTLTAVAAGRSTLADALGLQVGEEAPDWDQFWSEVERRDRQNRMEIEGFAKGMAGRRPVVSRVLSGVILGIFILELLTEAPEYPPAMYRLGVLDPDAVRAGEVWRLGSSTFLHGSILHLGLNLMVLWSLGGMLERVLGSARFMVLYAASALAGGLVSMFLMDGRSVGASGALWGMLAAVAVLAWRTRGVFPTSFQAGLRQGAIQNLGINVAASLLPGIDWAAHAGGGLVGLLLLGLGPLTAGLPRWAEDPSAQDRVPALVRVAAWVAGTVLFACPILAIGLGGVGELGAPALRHTVTLQSGWSVRLPEGLSVAAADVPVGEGEEVFGDLGRDPAMISVSAEPFPTPVDEASLDALRDAVERSAAEPGEGWEVGRPFSWRAAGGARVFAGSLSSPGEADLQRAVVLLPEGVCRVDAAVWQEAGPAWIDVAVDVARGCTPPAR